MSAVSSSSFMNLPPVMQTMVATYVPKNDLGISAAVSKKFKAVVESNLIWEKFAKEMQIDIKDHQNVKLELMKKYGEEIKKANETIIAILPEQEKTRVSAISNPFDQKKEIISCLNALMWDRFNRLGDKVYSGIDNLVIRTGAYFQFPNQSWMRKSILRTLYEGVGNKLKTVYSSSQPFLGGPYFCTAGNQDPEIFKAYIKGAKELSPGNKWGLFGDEIDHAIEKCCPTLLKLLLQEEEPVSKESIYEVFLKIVFPQVNDKNGEEMLAIIQQAVAPNFSEKISKALIFAKEQAAEVPSPDPTGEARYRAKERIKTHLYAALQ